MTEVELVQAVLVAEHAAVYAYGVVGARLDGVLLGQAQAAYDAHRLSRDALRDLLLARRAAAPGTRATYDAVAGSQGDALALAVRLEEGLSVRWRDLVAGTDDRALRGLAVAGLTQTAVRAARWRVAVGLGAPTVALPGAG